MHPSPRRLLPVAVVAAGAVAAWWWSNRPPVEPGALTAAGTIETREVRVGAEVGGRVTHVAVTEGDSIRAGELLVTLDDALVQAQIAQARANLEAAEGNLEAAQERHRAALASAVAASAQAKELEAGPSLQQLAVAKAGLERAEVALAGLEEERRALPAAAGAAAEGRALDRQIAQARAAVTVAVAEMDLRAAGPQEGQLAAANAQSLAAAAQAGAAAGAVRAARGQAEVARTAVDALEVQLARLTLRAPTAGVILERAVEPGEVALPGATLLVVGQLHDLSITVFLPVDRYGAIELGQPARVTVDSFADEAFDAVVTRIADRAEFTPRNVQTAQGRRSTVYAVRLSLGSGHGRLRPGMPADVTFEP